MKALVCVKYGPPEALQLKDVDKPVPGDNEVLVKIRAAGLNAMDWHVMRGDPFPARAVFGGLLRPGAGRILGADVAGLVEAVGKSVTRIQPGDAVYGDLFGSGYGSFAEYACAREGALARMPANLSFEQAAAVPIAALTALQALRDRGRIKPGQKVLIYGASGGVGTYAVQLAKVLGADVTAVCSTGKMDLARSIGASSVIDYKREDFSKSGLKYDLILAANGFRSVFAFRRALSPGGVLVSTGGSMAQLFQIMLLKPVVRAGGREMSVMTAKFSTADMDYLTGLLESGAIAPVIDRRFAFADAVPALNYLEEGHAAGKIVLTMI